MPNNNIVGNKIRFFRNEKGITQKALADLIGKTESSIQKYECGSTEVPFSVLEKIAKALDITILFLLDDEYLESASAYFEEKGEAKTSSLFHDMASLNKKLAANIDTSYTQILNNLFSMLNDNGKKKALERIEELLEISRYTNPEVDPNKEDDTQ